MAIPPEGFGVASYVVMNADAGAGLDGMGVSWTARTLAPNVDALERDLQLEVSLMTDSGSNQF
jgi:hypothetical protein